MSNQIKKISQLPKTLYVSNTAELTHAQIEKLSNKVLNELDSEKQALELIEEDPTAQVIEYKGSYFIIEEAVESGSVDSVTKRGSYIIKIK